MAEHDPAVVEAPAEPPPDVCMLSDTAHECQPLQLEPVEEHEEDAAAKRSRVGSEEDEEEGLVLLPRHTKVVVTGNNRTKSALVGLHGVVQKAVGLGGWHWLTLQGGTEVRLQRNALTVLENPPPELTALERHDEVEDRPQASRASTAAPAVPKLRPKRPPPSPTADTDDVLDVRRVVTRRDRSQRSSTQRIDFAKLDAAPLRKYRRHYKLEVGANASKDQLVTAVQRHFSGQQVDESHVLAAFILAVMGVPPAAATFSPSFDA